MKKLLVLLTLALLPATVMAAGPHEDLDCTGCHSLHEAEGEIIFALKANTTDINPSTNKPYAGVTSLCLSCHQSEEKGGQDILPVARHMSHPFGLDSVNPKVARVPEELLREGRFECIGCHDPHPSNPNYKYLRVDTDGGSSITSFCVVCHPMKASSEAVKDATFFNSMDERNFEAAKPVEAIAPK